MLVFGGVAYPDPSCKGFVDTCESSRHVSVGGLLWQHLALQHWLQGVLRADLKRLPVLKINTFFFQNDIESPLVVRLFPLNSWVFSIPFLSFWL